MDSLLPGAETGTLILEVAIGFVLGVFIVRAMPPLIPSRWLIGLSLAGIAIVAIVGAFVYPFEGRTLVLVAVLSSYVVAGAALRTAEVRARHTADELILLALALLSVVVAGALLGYTALALVAGLGSPTILVLAFVGAVLIATAFGLIVLFMDRGGKRTTDWRATAEAARMIDER